MDTLAPTEAERAPGSPRPGLPVIPGYQVLGEVGHGGMGIVYKAIQTHLKRIVALKMLRRGRAGPEDLERFRREAEAVARLQHPNIVQIYEIGEHDQLPFFSLEFVEGGGLDRRIAGTPQSPRDSAVLVATLAQAMQAAHEKDVI